MKRQLFLGTMFSTALAVGLAAQTPSPTAGQAGTAAQDKSNQQITVTGCLQGSGGATGTSGTAGAGSSAPQFRLTNAMKGGGSKEGGAPGAAPSGTAGTASSAAGDSYNLMGSASDLQKHVGKKVEIRGTMQSSSEAGGAPSSATGGAAAGASSSSGQTLRVTSVKEVSGSC